MNFSYDNSPQNVHNPNQPPKRVRFGLQSTDEMGELWLMVLPRVPEQRNLVGQSLGVHLAQVSLNYNEELLRENPYDADAHLKAGSARLALGQLPAARDHFRAVIRSDPGNDKAWFEMGTLYALTRQTDEAQRAFEQVLRLNPDDYEAEGRLGNICLQKGEFDKAEAHFRAALKLNPDDEIARKNLEVVVKLKEQRGK
jgi:Flp pilus assembly protein TadD